jgi:hypothetical protein
MELESFIQKDDGIHWMDKSYTVLVSNQGDVKLAILQQNENEIKNACHFY